MKKPIRTSDYSRYSGPSSSKRYDSELLYLLFLFKKIIQHIHTKDVSTLSFMAASVSFSAVDEKLSVLTTERSA
jgi:hypothetical protein